MRVRHLSVDNFRGVKSLDWRPSAPFICLVGAGDSAKTTILDALHLALSPRYYEAFNDADFHGCVVSEPIRIVATVGDVPYDLIRDKKFGHLLRGWSPEGRIRDEPEDEDERVLSVRLVVDDSMEPVWSVFADRDVEGRRISSADRQLLGAFRFTDYADRELAWGKASALSRITAKDAVDANLLAEAGRTARAVLSEGNLKGLEEAAKSAQKLGLEVGVATRADFKAGLDLAAVKIRSGGIALHEGDVPARCLGLGSRRLLAMALQRKLVRNGGVMLIDEIENGLEPHRLRGLLRHLRKVEPKGDGRQVIMTTHSSIAVAELNASELQRVHEKDGVVWVQPVAAELQGLVRSHPEAFLARKVLVCEGSTEVGFVWGLDEYWQTSGREGLALLGVVPTAGTRSKGGGSQAPAHAASLSQLGFAVALLADSDRDLTPSSVELAANGVTVIQWDGESALEQRVAQDLPWDGVVRLLEASAQLHDIKAIKEAVGDQIEVEPKPNLGDEIEKWAGLIEDTELRRAVGVSAVKRSWFKSVSGGLVMGKIVGEFLDQIPESDLARKLASLRKWIDE